MTTERLLKLNSRILFWSNAKDEFAKLYEDRRRSHNSSDVSLYRDIMAITANRYKSLYQFSHNRLFKAIAQLKSEVYAK